MKKLIIISLTSLLFLAGCSQSTPNVNLDDFAKCLTQKGAIMYGSVNCSHCLTQKKMFGDSFQYINYVECTEEFDRCANISGVPTWEISEGNFLEGRQELAVLAKATNCELPKE